MHKNTSPLTDDEIETAASLLARQPAGYLPLKLFLQVMRLVVASIIEIVPLRMKPSGKVQVLLTKRNDSYSLWPDTLHTPGVVLRPTDKENSYDDAFRRILEEELEGVRILQSPQFVCHTLHKSKRGMENALVFFVEVADTPPVGSLYDIDNMPNNLMESQHDFILKAADIFKKTKMSAKS